MLSGKCKFPSAKVRCIGTISVAANFIVANEPKALNVAVIGACLKVGDDEAVQVGSLGAAITGDRGTAIAGSYGTAIAGSYGTAITGDRGTATAGSYGTATAGYLGTATAGSYGTATAGYLGAAITGDRGTAIAGSYGTAMAGEGGEIRIQWWDIEAQRYCTKIGHVGEDGIKADIAYRLNDNNEFEEVKEEE